MQKSSWKRRGFNEDRIREVLRTSRSLTVAARTLGVDRSTLHRWIEKDPSLKAAREIKAVTTAQVVKQGEGMSPDAWAESVRNAYELTPTEAVLVDLAHIALSIAQDASERPSDRLNAMARFARLVQQLALEAPVGEAKSRLYAV